MRRPLLTLLLVAAVPLTVVLAVRFGPQPLTGSQVLAALLGEGPDSTVLIVRRLRLPRVLLALWVGGGLALAGATFQALLRNPLAEPYILGISGGAAAGAVAVLSLGLAATATWALPLAAFAGALVAIVLVFRVASAADRRLDVRVLLLAGVVVGAFFTAVVAFLLSVSEARQVQDAVLWMMGDLTDADWGDVAVAAAYTLPAGLLLVGLARPLNVMAIGEETAFYLGTDAERVKRLAFGVASLVTAAGVAVAGVIGFVGLVVPHGIRILVGSDHRWLLPLSFLAGAVFLALADVLAQVVLRPAVIPVGVVTAFVGVPLFLVLLRRTLTR
ncbi:MAG TPA: iron ABC transporter permease [Longimicrobiales bacterium]|nr:iron ABC transporter permease [Longimicrobiales bacterium]